jgi:uncharacterized protein YndB with AHSA1/START domain
MPTADRSGTTKFALPSDTTIAARRFVEAPRQEVFDAWTKPEHVTQWMLGPAGWTMPVCEIDLRPGGEWHFVWLHADGTELELSGVYRGVDPPVRLVSTESWGPEWPRTLNSVVLDEQDGRTTITCTILYPSKEARDAALGPGMREGMSESYDRLAAYLPKI